MIRKFVSALVGAFLLAASFCPANALTFHWSFAGGNIEGFITGLVDNQFNQFADSVTVTASTIGGIGEYVPAIMNEFDVSGGAISPTSFFESVGPTGELTYFLLILGNIGFFQNIDTELSLEGAISFTRVADVPLPAALPLFASGIGALGLLGWRRKRKAAALAA